MSWNKNESKINKLSIRGRFTFAIVAVLLVVTFSFYGIRLLGQMVLFHHAERNHMHRVMKLDVELSAVEKEIKGGSVLTIEGVLKELAVI